MGKRPYQLLMSALRALRSSAPGDTARRRSSRRLPVGAGASPVAADFYYQHLLFDNMYCCFFKTTLVLINKLL